MLEALASELDSTLAGQTIVERLKTIRAAIPGRIVFTTSLGIEDQALTHIIASNGIEIEFATLDTGGSFRDLCALAGDGGALQYPHQALLSLCREA